MAVTRFLAIQKGHPSPQNGPTRITLPKVVHVKQAELVRVAQYSDSLEVCHHERSEGSALCLIQRKADSSRPKPGAPNDNNTNKGLSRTLLQSCHSCFNL